MNSLTDSLLVMYAGEIVETLPDVREIQSLYHPYSRHLLLPFEARDGIEDAGLSEESTDGRYTGCPYAPRCVAAEEGCRHEQIPVREYGAGHFVRCRKDQRAGEAGS